LASRPSDARCRCRPCIPSRVVSCAGFSSKSFKPWHPADQKNPGLRSRPQLIKTNDTSNPAPANNASCSSAAISEDEVAGKALCHARAIAAMCDLQERVSSSIGRSQKYKGSTNYSKSSHASRCAGAAGSGSGRSVTIRKRPVGWKQAFCLTC